MQILSNQKVKKKKRIGKFRKKAIDDNDAPNDSEKDNFNNNYSSANNEIPANSELNDNPFTQPFELEELKKNRKKNYIENSNILDKILNNLYDNKKQEESTLTKNNTAFLISFFDSKDFKSYKKIQKYVKNLAAGYSFGHAVQIENDNSENIIILYYMEYLY